ncbi:MAG: type IV secretion system DNA-binding domain-containing protein [Candidatus Woesebacteria bacterium]|nr:type IV secretion system DNA-binding domain-containing protein [Candidatus Woesebacteria bacterium]
MITPDLNTLFAFLILIIFLVFTMAVIGYTAFIIFRYRGREERSVDSVYLQISVPRLNEIKIDAMEQLFASLYSIKKGGWKQNFAVQPAISFEIIARSEDIKFFVWTPSEYKDLVERQVHGAYPDAEIKEVQEINLFEGGGSPDREGKVAYKSLQLSKANYYPLKTFKDLPTDILASLTSSLAKLGEDEGACVQILISPADSGWQKAGGKFISDTKKQESSSESAKYSVSGKALEAVENKISKPGYETSIRIIVTSGTKEKAKMNLDNIVSSLSQVAGEHNSLGSRKIYNKGGFMQDFLYRYQPMFNLLKNHVSVLNSEELATLFHFPNRQITTPHIHWLHSKTAPAPAEIPEEGLYLGKSIYRGVTREIAIGDDDRRRHMFIIGATGVGKTELLKSMIMQDINAGRGICFMDPHGDAVEDILKLIPPERAEDVIYFRPSDTERPMGLNLLEANTEDEKHFVASSIINMMYKLFDPYKTGIVGPRFEHAVRNAMLTIMSEPGATFVELMRVLTDARYVQELLPKVTDPIIRRYWTDQIAQTSDFHKSEVLDYIVSKFGRFVTNKMIRNIIGQSTSSFSFRDVMDNRKILLINLAKGELGEENSNFLGLILVPRILMAAMSRSDTPEDKRRDFYLYVDEFQNFATPDFAVILSEARKYKLNLTVANQFIGQMEEEVKNAVFGNVGTKISFRVGVTDANYLQHEFAPTFGEDDLLNVERFHAYVKTIVNNQPQPPFSLDTTLDLAKIKALKNDRTAEIIIEMSRLKHGRDARLVEAEITRRAKL